MIDRKVKHLILLSRTSVRSEAAQELLDELQTRGVNVAAPPCDVGDEQALAFVLKACRKSMPPVKGCIQGTMALKVTFSDSL